jgi:hypothetical protein
MSSRPAPDQREWSHFRLNSAYFCFLSSKAPPIRGRELSSREAVLPFCTCVKEDGLQGPTGGPAEATRHGVRARLDFGFVDLVYGALVESTEQIRLIGTLPQKKWPGPNKGRFGASTP